MCLLVLISAESLLTRRFFNSEVIHIERENRTLNSVDRCNRGKGLSNPELNNPQSVSRNLRELNWDIGIMGFVKFIATKGNITCWL